MAFVLAVVLSLALLAAGCTPATPAATPTTAPAAAATTQVPAATTSATQIPVAAGTGSPAATAAAATATANPSAKQITILMTQEPDSLHPHAGAMMAKSEVYGALFSQCVLRDNNNAYIPWGCESVPTIDNGGAKFVGEGADRHLEITFKLKNGWKWHDGTPVTSNDVKFTIEALQNPDFEAAQLRDYALKVAEVATPDPKTAVVKLMSENQAKKAANEGWVHKNAQLYEGYDAQVGPVLDPLYFSVMADGGDQLLPAHILGKIDPSDWTKSDWARKPIGNGPYKFKEWVAAQMIVLEAADNGLFKPQIQTIIFKIVADATAVLNSLAAGEAQVTAQVGLDADQTPEIEQLAQQGRIKPYYIPSTGWEHIDFNLQNPLFQDKRVRQAIAYAIDRDTMTKSLMYGKSQVVHSWITPPNQYLDDAALKKYEFNVQKAKDLLAQSGWKMGSGGVLEKDGKPFRVTLHTTDAKIRTAIGQLVQANLRDVGIQVDPQYLPGRGLMEADGPILSHKFQMTLYTWWSDPDPSPVNLYSGKNCPDGLNFPCYKNPEFDQLALQSDSELSKAKRQPMISQLLKMWTEDLPVLPLFQRLNVTAASPKLQGFKPAATETPETWNIHEWVLAN
ncbi:MAG: peptide ABC transporter substrate-binding protein [Chloroflexota bacterium]